MNFKLAIILCIFFGYVSYTQCLSIKPKEHKLGEDPCTRGPAYWCSSETAINQCNAHVFCTKHQLSKRSSEPELLGHNPCTWGPDYWCSSDERTNRCNAQEFCAKLRRTVQA